LRSKESSHRISSESRGKSANENKSIQKFANSPQTIGPLAAGSYTFAVRYPGDSIYSGATHTETLTINQGTSSVATTI
jgi:hypothetical protein